MKTNSLSSKCSYCAGLALRLQDMLNSVSRDHFSRTSEGVKNDYDACFNENQQKNCFGWVYDHYESAAAVINAAVVFTDILAEKLEELDTIAKDDGQK